MSKVYWTPGAARWLENAARRRRLEREYEVAKIKDALRSAAWRKRHKGAK